MESKRIVVEAYKKSPGAKGGYRYALMDKGKTWYSTFDEGIFEAVGGWNAVVGCKQTGDPVEIQFETNEKGFNDLKAVAMAGAEPPRAGNPIVEIGEQVNREVIQPSLAPSGGGFRPAAEAAAQAGFHAPGAVERNLPPTMEKCISEAWRLLRGFEGLDLFSPEAAAFAVNLASEMHRQGRL